MAVRIISSIIAIPILLFFIIYGGLPLEIAVTVISLIGMYEIYKAVSGKIKAVHIIGFLLEILYAFYITNENISVNYVKAVLGIAIVAILFILVVCHKTNNINDASITIFGFIYLGLLLSFICYIRNVSIIFAWLPFIFAFGSDTGAYFIGSKFGKHKLTPELSPKKSIEGAIGGVVSAAVLSGVYAFVCNKLYMLDIKFVVIFIIAGGFGSVVAQFGDLAASSIKRFVGIKDYGKLMPGHGGVLDRFDSVLFTLPLVYMLMLLFA